MQATYSYLRRGASAFAGLAALALVGVGAKADTTPKQADAFPLFDNYIIIGGQDASLTGDSAAFQAHTQQPKSGSGGIEDFHYGKDMGKDTTMTFDGRAMAGSADYLGKLSLAKTDFGSFEMGYKTFRTYYDGVGGFFPTSNIWTPMSPENLHVDRGQFWVEGKLNMPNMPEFTLKYSNETRDGMKDSTIWGDSDFTGMPNNNPPYSQVRKLAPTYLQLGERHESLELSMKHTVGKTNFEVALTGERTKNVDTTFITRFPGEVKPYPTPASTVLLPPESMNNQVVQNTMEGIDGHLFTGRATVETVFSEKFKFFANAIYQDLNNDFSGDRPIWTTTPTKVGVVIAASNNNQNLAGTSKGTNYIGNLGMEFTPTKDFSAKLAVKGEDNYTKSAASLTSVSASVNATTGVVTTTPTNQLENSRVKETAWTPDLDLRYTGIKDVALYASFNTRISSGDERYTTPYSTPVAASSALSYVDSSTDHANYKIGANWRVSQAVTFRGELFYRDHTTKSLGYGPSLDDLYELNTKFTGVKLTDTTKLNDALTVTVRYVYQKGKAQVTGILLSTGTPYDSMDAKNHTFGATIDWTPTTQFYFQANGNLVFNVIGTVYPRAGTAPAGSSPAWDVNNVLKDSNNNYFDGSLLAGAVLTKTDDLQFQVTYYKAANGDSQLASTTLPYGVATEETSVSVGLKHKFSDRLMGHAKVGYFDSKNDTTGGNTNFHGPQAYVSLDYAL